MKIFLFLSFLLIINYFFLILIIFLFFSVEIMASISRFLLQFRFLIDFEIINFINNRFNFILFIDFFRRIFLITVILISTRVFTFRRSYIRIDKYYKRFHYLLLSFVISILILILRPNLIRILLGWDGLGISSYLLVIYYSLSLIINFSYSY